MEDVDKRKILSQIREEVRGLGEIGLAYVFGSFLREGGFNDVDLGIITGSHGPCDEKAAVRIAREIERRIEPRIELDVKILNSARSHFSTRL
jgi:predicted nucleotidyltransferase